MVILARPHLTRLRYGDVGIPCGCLLRRIPKRIQPVTERDRDSRPDALRIIAGERGRSRCWIELGV